MLKIRLSRIGKRKKPSYKIIVSESTRDPWGRNEEVLGTYDPFGKVCVVKKDRVLHWIANGAQLSPTIHNLFLGQNVITGKKVVASGKGKKAEAARLAAVADANKPKVAEEASPASSGDTASSASSESPEAAPVEAPAPAATEEKTEDTEEKKAE